MCRLSQAKAFLQALEPTSRGSHATKGSACFSEFIGALHNVAQTLYGSLDAARDQPQAPSAENFQAFLREAILTVRMARVYDAGRSIRVPKVETFDGEQEPETPIDGASANGLSMLDRYRTALARVYLFAAAAARSAFRTPGVDPYDLAIRKEYAMTWPQFHRLCCLLGLAQLASNRAVADAFLSSHRNLDKSGLMKHFGYVFCSASPAVGTSKWLI